MTGKYSITPLSELPLHNDFMFGQVMRSEEICKLFLEELLGINIQRIEFIDRQKDLSDSYEYHGIRLDVYLKDEQGTVFNVELESDRRHDLQKRVRFYQSGIDRSELPKGADYAVLSESYIIFICDFDYFHIGKAVGERVSLLKGTDVPYEDGSHVFFLNSRYQEANASKSILEFLDLVQTNDVDKPYETALGRMLMVNKEAKQEKNAKDGRTHAIPKQKWTETAKSRTSARFSCPQPRAWIFACLEVGFLPRLLFLEKLLRFPPKSVKIGTQPYKY